MPGIPGWTLPDFHRKGTTTDEVGEKYASSMEKFLSHFSHEIMVTNKKNKPLSLISLPSIGHTGFFDHFAYIRNHSETSNRNFPAFVTLFLFVPFGSLVFFPFFTQLCLLKNADGSQCESMQARS